MTDPIEAEKMVFEEEFNNTLAEMVNRLSEEFTEQFYSDLKQSLRAGGVLCCQTGDWVLVTWWILQRKQQTLVTSALQQGN